MPHQDFEPKPARDPVALARGDRRQNQIRRFYQQASVEVVEGYAALLLDGRLAHTPRRHPLRFRSRALAERIAAEWQLQGPDLDPLTMPITRIVQSGLDFAAADAAAVQADILRFAGSDLLCYRAGSPASLVQAQATAWDPILAWASANLRARFVCGEGIVPIAQPPAALAAVRTAIAAFEDSLMLAALATLTSLTGSALLALAVAHGRISAREAWVSAHVDEEFQERHWGIDALAQQRRANHLLEMEAAQTILAFSGA
jgi:chaperone required for assembly of F1-ATPase